MPAEPYPVLFGLFCNQRLNSTGQNGIIAAQVIKPR